MFAHKLFLTILIAVSAAVSQSAQTPQPRFIWDNNLVNCGTNNGSISCLVTLEDHRQLTFKHKDLTISISHAWSSEDLRVIVSIENVSEKSVPVDVESWSLTSYKSIEDLLSEKDPIRISPAKRPRTVSNTSDMLDTSLGRLPNNSPVARSQSRPPATGNLPGQDGAASNRSSRISIRSAGKSYDAATKWAEVKARSKVVGELRFPYEPGTTYVAVAFNVNGANYVYRLARR